MDSMSVKERQISIARREMRLAKTDSEFMAARALLTRALAGEIVFSVSIAADGEITYTTITK